MDGPETGFIKEGPALDQTSGGTDALASLFLAGCVTLVNLLCLFGFSRQEAV